ncbi:MAG: heme o synthase, partial [Shewanella sp.]
MAKPLSITSSLPTFSVTWRAYFEMTKPKVVALMLLTVLVGMCLAVP